MLRLELGPRLASKEELSLQNFKLAFMRPTGRRRFWISTSLQQCGGSGAETGDGIMFVSPERAEGLWDQAGNHQSWGGGGSRGDAPTHCPTSEARAGAGGAVNGGWG